MQNFNDTNKQIDFQIYLFFIILLNKAFGKI